MFRGCSCAVDESAEVTLAEWGMQVFYAACQALLYILCYRLEQLWKEAEPARSLESTSPTGVLDSGAREQLTRLFSDIMPQLLNHRCAPM